MNILPFLPPNSVAIDHVAGAAALPAPPRARLDRPVAYLTNVYPKPSHGFIRTEIEALERAGMKIDRITIRRPTDKLVDPRDRVESARTMALLEGNWLSLAGCVLRRAVRAPLGTIDALKLALRHVGAPGAIRALAYFAEAAGLAEHLARRGIGHVHVHFGTNPAAVARIAARMAPITYSFTVHGPDEFDAPRALALAGKIADAAFVVGVSDYGRGQLMRWSHPRDWDRIEVVRCSVGRDFLAAASDSANDSGADVRALSSRRLVCVARLDAQKGLPLLIEAAAHVAREHRFELRIIGDGDQRAAIEEAIARHGLGDHVRLLGWQSSDVVRREIAAARALVLASFAEGLPVVLMEAMAMGRPVIATAVAGVPELVDAQAGWLIPCGSVDAIAGAMRAALQASPDTLGRMGEVGRERVARAHDPDRNGTLLAALLRTRG